MNESLALPIRAILFVTVFLQINYDYSTSMITINLQDCGFFIISLINVRSIGTQSDAFAGSPNTLWNYLAIGLWLVRSLLLKTKVL
jgi:hypothetical protein